MMDDIHFVTSHASDISAYMAERLKKMVKGGIGAFSMYQFSDDLDPPEFDDLDDAVLSAWGKRSCFMMRIESEGAEYWCVSSVMPRGLARVSTPAVHREWAMSVNVLQKVEPEDKVDLESGHDRQRAMDGVANHFAGTTLFLMRAILERPTEYRMARGIRTPRQRALNIPATVTISLSKPRI